MSGDHYEEYTSFGLVMPFVVCRSNGGPYEDQAFVSGWRCGEIDRTLRNMDGVNARATFVVMAEELPQLDLIAMHRGFALDKKLAGEQDQETGWCVVEFYRPADFETDTGGES